MNYERGIVIKCDISQFGMKYKFLFNLQPSTFNLQPSTFNLQPSLSLKPSTFGIILYNNIQVFALNCQPQFVERRWNHAPPSPINAYYWS